MRARDIDRANTSAALDTAYAEGQLEADEYHDRQARARSARTLAELSALTDDLQGVPEQVAAPPMPARKRSSPSRWYLSAVTVAALAAAYGAYAVTARPVPEPPPERPAAVERPVTPPPEPGPVEPLVVGTPALVTAEGVAKFIEAYRLEFGDTVADEVLLYPDHGSISRAPTDRPNRPARYDYRGGFRQSGGLVTRKVGTPTVDLAAVNIPALGAALADVVVTTRVPDGTVHHIQVRCDGLFGARVPTVTIFVDNTFRESGYIRLDPSGRVLSVHEFEG